MLVSSCWEKGYQLAGGCFHFTIPKLSKVVGAFHSEVSDGRHDEIWVVFLQSRFAQESTEDRAGLHAKCLARSNVASRVGQEPIIRTESGDCTNELGFAADSTRHHN